MKTAEKENGAVRGEESYIAKKYRSSGHGSAKA